MPFRSYAEFTEPILRVLLDLESITVFIFYKVLEGDEMDSASEELLKTVAIGLKRQLSGLSPEAVSIFLLLATGKENAQTLAAVLGQALEHVNRSLAELTQRRLVEAIDSVIMHTDKGQTIYSSIIDK